MENQHEKRTEILNWMEEYLDGTNPERTALGFIKADIQEYGFDGWIDLDHEVVIDSFYETTEEMSEMLVGELKTILNQEQTLDELGIEQTMKIDQKELISSFRNGMLDIFKSMQIYFDVKRQAETDYRRR
jgi:hypothetical protein